MLWALTPDDWVRAEVLAAHDAAVAAALGWFETQGGVTRRGRDGVLQVDTTGVAAAAFRHHTSRMVDPQLHTHAVISSKVQDETGKWLALDARFLKYQQRTIGWVFDAALRTELTNRLGVGWVEHDEGILDLACIPDRVRELFSQRSDQVDTKLGELIDRWRSEHDGDDPEPWTIAQLERSAVLASRPAKIQGLDAAQLHRDWRQQAENLGFDPQRLTSHGLGDAARSGAVPDEQVVAEVLRRVSEESAGWLRADLARHVARLLSPQVAPTGERLVAEIDRLAALAEARCVPLDPERGDTVRHRRDGRPVTEHITDRLFTTPTALVEEQDLMRWATAAVAQVDADPDPARAAARAMAGRDRLVLVVGPAGTGKTHTTARAVKALQGAGRPVVGLAPSGKAANVLATATGCRADTMAGFLTRHQGRRTNWPADTTVILDEAAMASTADLVRLVALARANRWRLVAVGDPAQLSSVGRGGVFAHWSATLPHHTLDTPRRFTEPWEAAASLALRAGDRRGVEVYAAHGRLQSTHPALVAAQVARLVVVHEVEGRAVAVTTNTAETAKAINQAIQRTRYGSSRVGVSLHDGSTAVIGDRVATRRNDLALRTTAGARVRNRQTWTVANIETSGDVVLHHPDRGDVLLPGDYVARHVELGWAVTGYGNQGDTVDVGIAVLEASTSHNHAYVAMTRGRTSNVAIVVDPTGTTDPAERLAEIITRPANSESALAIRHRLHEEAGIQEPDLPEPAAAPRPSPSLPFGPDGDELDDQVARMRARLDALQARDTDRSVGRGLSL